MLKLVIVFLCLSGIHYGVTCTDATEQDSSHPTLDLYYTQSSSPCRTVLMTANVLGIKMNLLPTNLSAGDHLTPEFKRLNPQHTVPTLVDNGYPICESRAIIIYLVEKYGKDDSLYPKDPEKRALVTQRLFFDATVLYQRFADAYYPVVFHGQPLDEQKVKRLKEAFEFLDTFLEENEFVAGNTFTIADISLVASVTTAQACSFDISKYANVGKWLNRAMYAIPDYDEANKGVEVYVQKFAAATKKQ